MASPISDLQRPHKSTGYNDLPMSKAASHHNLKNGVSLNCGIRNKQTGEAMEVKFQLSFCIMRSVNQSGRQSGYLSTYFPQFSVFGYATTCRSYISDCRHSTLSLVGLLCTRGRPIHSISDCSSVVTFLHHVSPLVCVISFSSWMLLSDQVSQPCVIYESSTSALLAHFCFV